jgi:hypothetical protein
VLHGKGRATLVQCERPSSVDDAIHRILRPRSARFGSDRCRSIGDAKASPRARVPPL